MLAPAPGLGRPFLFTLGGRCIPERLANRGSGGCLGALDALNRELFRSEAWDLHVIVRDFWVPAVLQA